MSVAKTSPGTDVDSHASSLTLFHLRRRENRIGHCDNRLPPARLHEPVARIEQAKSPALPGIRSALLWGGAGVRRRARKPEFLAPRFQRADRPKEPEAQE